LTAFVVGVPENSPIEIAIGTSASAKLGHADGKALVPAGFTVVGGGCKTSWAPPEPGNYLFNGYPVSDGFICSSKDHAPTSAAVLTSYAIGVKSSAFDIVTGPSVAVDSLISSRTQVASTMDLSQGVGIVGGGCKTTYNVAGRLLTASFPDISGNAWRCASKDHKTEDSGTLTPYSVGLKPRIN
jgi:hypothetical protein